MTLLRNGEPFAEVVPVKSPRERINPLESSEEWQPPAEKHSRRKFGILKDHGIVIDLDWDRPRNDVEAWLRGEVRACSRATPQSSLRHHEIPSMSPPRH